MSTTQGHLRRLNLSKELGTSKSTVADARLSVSSHSGASVQRRMGIELQRNRCVGDFVFGIKADSKFHQWSAGS